MFSTFLSNNKDKIKQLVQELKQHYKYVSVLGNDTKAMNYMVHRGASMISDGRDSERGFVAKLSNGGAFYEYSFDEVPEDVASFAQEIINEVKLPEMKEGEVEKSSTMKIKRYKELKKNK